MCVCVCVCVCVCACVCVQSLDSSHKTYVEWGMSIVALKKLSFLVQATSKLTISLMTITYRMSMSIDSWVVSFTSVEDVVRKLKIEL